MPDLVLSLPVQLDNTITATELKSLIKCGSALFVFWKLMDDEISQLVLPAFC